LKTIIITICMLFVFAVTGCSHSNADLPSSEGNSAPIDTPIVGTDPATKEECYAKYIKPLSLGRALEMEWKEPKQLFSTEIQLVGCWYKAFLQIMIGTKFGRMTFPRHWWRKY